MAALMAVYVGLLIPTGQRGFALALGIVVLVVFTYDGRLSTRQFAAIILAGFVLVGVTQAARNAVRETDSLGPGEVLSRLAPGEWRDLYGDQLASFNWTVEVAAYRDKLDAPNPFPRALLKPIPRQIYPEKSQGFGSDFTSQVYPGASDQHVSFAPPLIAEADYAFGPAGVLLIFLTLGCLAALAELMIARAAPRALEPLLLATIGWCVFVLVRGDFANALVAAAGWVIPLAAASWYLGMRREPRGGRVVIDALQVPPAFSGVGRIVMGIGHSLGEVELGRPLEVRCAADVVDELRPHFPAGTTFRLPLRSSRPRALRIFYQQLLAPLLDPRTTLLVCPGDQAPIWGRAPVVLTIMDARRLARPDTSETRLEALFYRTILRRGARRAARVLTISEFSRDEIRRTLGVEPGASVVAIHPPPRDRAGEAGSEGLRFLTVGALRKYKGIETVIEALAELRRSPNGEVPEVICVGGGEGRERDLEAYSRRLGVADRFRIVGWVDDDALETLYRSAAATINPSIYEGYGLPVGESLAHGLPTLASDIPPHREVADDAALYFQPGDATGLAAEIKRVASDRALRERLGHKAMKRSQELSGSGPSWGEAIAAAAGSVSQRSRRRGQGLAADA
jgi:glycosyltransferase involved in cell wall biosynthesis